MAPQLNDGSFSGKQPEVPSDPEMPLHETCWIWKPEAGIEHWVLYAGPPAAHPYVAPSSTATDVWLRIEHLDSASAHADLPAFVAWVLARLGAQGRPNAASDVLVRTHTVV